ncbi:hypothetical protein Tco_0570634 [Tanacetum coccineum]
MLNISIASIYNEEHRWESKKPLGLRLTLVVYLLYGSAGRRVITTAGGRSYKENNMFKESRNKLLKDVCVGVNDGCVCVLYGGSASQIMAMYMGLRIIEIVMNSIFVEAVMMITSWFENKILCSGSHSVIPTGTGSCWFHQVLLIVGHGFLLIVGLWFLLVVHGGSFCGSMLCGGQHVAPEIILQLILLGLRIKEIVGLMRMTMEPEITKI